MSELTKTIRLKLQVSNEQEKQFLEMMERFQDACNFVSKYIFEHEFCLDKKILQEKLYYELRNRFHLKAQLAISVIRTVIAHYETLKTQMSKTPFRYKTESGTWKKIPRTLEWLWKPINFKVPQVDLVYNRDYSFVEKMTKLSINTLTKRTKCTFEIKHYEEYFDGTWKLGTAKLVKKNKKWYLHISVTKNVEDLKLENTKHIVGIDRGLRFLAVSYDEQGKTRFYSGKEIARKRQIFQKVRSELQAKGTKSAKRKLKQISERENRWMTDVNHCLSKTLVREYGQDTAFVLEDLTGVSFEKSNLSKNKEWNHNLTSWAFYQLEQFLDYKARDNKSRIVIVSGMYTSQRCPKCGKIRGENRNHTIHLYSCSCGYHSNDDRSAAMNIYELGKRWANGEEKPRYEISRTSKTA